MDSRRRTESRQGHSDNVYIREVGVPPGAEAGGPMEADAQSAEPHRGQHPNRPFRAAWLFTGILVGVGLLWVAGVFDVGPTSSYGTTVSVDPATGLPVEPDFPSFTLMLRNLGFMAPFMLLTGLMSAAALLIAQGVRKSQTLLTPSSEQESQQR